MRGVCLVRECYARGVSCEGVLCEGCGLRDMRL